MPVSIEYSSEYDNVIYCKFEGHWTAEEYREGIELSRCPGPPVAVIADFRAAAADPHALMPLLRSVDTQLRYRVHMMVFIDASDYVKMAIQHARPLLTHLHDCVQFVSTMDEARALIEHGPGYLEEAAGD